ncbi:hypothetical protein SADUNF_Sadunf06G0102000 [Salix dunnii]|uniref:Acylphosphatase-like domain-containing protein n=1 Tax=Salix dunnii TaxID=1413687 RepID=A0A835JYI4_9ROSI|nr:hypothetical protein SADUNF_Sadunf06G0102000 [Salix dunnii]
MGFPGMQVRAMTKGTVQGVFYRNWTVENATHYSRDGSVEALFSGDSDNVQETEQTCRRARPHAMVIGFKVSPFTDDPETAAQSNSLMRLSENSQHNISASLYTSVPPISHTTGL